MFSIASVSTRLTEDDCGYVALSSVWVANESAVSNIKVVDCEPPALLYVTTTFPVGAKLYNWINGQMFVVDNPICPSVTPPPEGVGVGGSLKTWLYFIAEPSPAHAVEPAIVVVPCTPPVVGTIGIDTPTVSVNDGPKTDVLTQKVPKSNPNPSRVTVLSASWACDLSAK